MFLSLMNQQTDELLFKWKFLKFKREKKKKKSLRCDLDSFIFFIAINWKSFWGKFLRNDSKWGSLTSRFQISGDLHTFIHLRDEFEHRSDYKSILSTAASDQTKKFWISNRIEIQGARMREHFVTVSCATTWVRTHLAWSASVYGAWMCSRLMSQSI